MARVVEHGPTEAANMSNRAAYLVAGSVLALLAAIILWGVYIEPWLGR